MEEKWRFGIRQFLSSVATPSIYSSIQFIRTSVPCARHKTLKSIGVGCSQWLQKLMGIRHTCPFLLVKLVIKTREPAVSDHILSWLLQVPGARSNLGKVF